MPCYSRSTGVGEFMKNILTAILCLAATSSFAEERYLVMCSPDSSRIARHDLRTGQTIIFFNAQSYGNGILVAPNLNILVAGGSDSLTRYDGITGQFLNSIPVVSNGPHGLALDSQNRLYVTGQSNSDVRRYTFNSGNLIDTFVQSGVPQLNGGRGMVFDSDQNLYVASAYTNKIMKVTPQQVISDFGTGFSNPEDVEIGPDGNIYATSTFTNSVLKFTRTGTFLGVFADSNEGLSIPRGLCYVEFEGVGRFYVCNQTSNTITVLDVNGNRVNTLNMSASGMSAVNFIDSYNIQYENVSPNVFNVTEGLYAGGTLADFQENDSQYVYILNDEYHPNATITIASQITPSNLAGLNLYFEALCTRRSVLQAIDIRRYTTNSWINAHYQVATLTDSRVVHNFSGNLSQFVGPSGEVSIRAKWIPFEDLLNVDGWLIAMDCVEWEAIPSAP